MSSLKQAKTPRVALFVPKGRSSLQFLWPYVVAGGGRACRIVITHPFLNSDIIPNDSINHLVRIESRDPKMDAEMRPSEGWERAKIIVSIWFS